MPANPLYLLVGILLVGAVLLDMLWTTLSVEGGAGPLTSTSMVVAWRSLRRALPRGSRWLVLSGPVILVLTLASWLLGLWAGWTFVFAATEAPVADTVDPSPISWSDRIYFAGYAIFTLGNGDFAPAEGVWQIATTVATASGMLAVTLSVSYILSVLGAVTQKRSFASNVSGLGTRAEDIVEASWRDDEFRSLDGFLRDVAAGLNTLTANHKAYPVLHYFHSREPEQAPASTVPAFDEALTVIAAGLPEDVGPSDIALANARVAVQNYLDTLHSAFMPAADETPPPPDVDELADAGVPTVDDAAFEQALDDLEKRRRLLLGLARSDARAWPS